MSNPIFFFVIIFVVDLLLKSAKNKKKVEQARNTRTAEIKPTPVKPKSIMQTIKEEMEKEAQRASGKQVQTQPVKRMAQQKVYTEDQLISHKNSKEMMKESEIKKRTQWSEDIFDKPVAKVPEVREKREESLRQDILRGIIFSEIISEPKSIKNHRKSM